MGTRADFKHFKEQGMKPGVGNYSDQVATLKKAPQYGFGTTKRPVFAA